MNSIVNSYIWPGAAVLDSTGRETASWHLCSQCWPRACSSQVIPQAGEDAKFLLGQQTSSRQKTQRQILWILQQNSEVPIETNCRQPPVREHSHAQCFSDFYPLTPFHIKADSQASLVTWRNSPTCKNKNTTKKIWEKQQQQQEL